MPAPQQSKDALRAQARQTLRDLSPAAMAEASGQIVARLQAQPLFRGVTALASFAAWRGEPDLGAFTAWAVSRGIAVYYPRYDSASGVYGLGRVWATGELVPGHHGIREPLAGAPEAQTRRHLAWLVPGLGFDRAGNRLGRGAGDYDRMLADSRGPRLGVCFAAQLLDAAPCEAHDVPMHAVVTEAAWIAVPPRDG